MYLFLLVVPSHETLVADVGEEKTLVDSDVGGVLVGGALVGVPFPPHSLQPLPSSWLSLLAMGTLDSPMAHQTGTVHYPVRAMSARPLGLGAT
jgi:hypothetical protein